MKKLYEKKGQVTSSVSSIIVLIVGVGVSVMVLIFIGALGGQTYELIESDIDSIGNSSVVNETFTPINGTLAYFNHADIHTGTLSIINSSNSASIGLGNFTIDYDAGSYLLTSGTYVNDTALKATYDWGNYEIRTSIKNGIVSSFDALQQTGSYLPIIVLAVVISLVLMLVLGFTAFGGRNMGGTAL